MFLLRVNSQCLLQVHRQPPWLQIAVVAAAQVVRVVVVFVPVVVNVVRLVVRASVVVHLTAYLLIKFVKQP